VGGTFPDKMFRLLHMVFFLCKVRHASIALHGWVISNLENNFVTSHTER
jgi:hypothetical protein